MVLHGTVRRSTPWRRVTRANMRDSGCMATTAVRFENMGSKCDVLSPAAGGPAAGPAARPAAAAAGRQHPETTPAVVPHTPDT